MDSDTSRLPSQLAVRALTIDLVDIFHDLIDGDDPVVELKLAASNSIDLMLESGARLNVLVRELPTPASEVTG